MFICIVVSDTIVPFFGKPMVQPVLPVVRSTYFEVLVASYSSTTTTSSRRYSCKNIKKVNKTEEVKNTVMIATVH